jgi:hypothetical protein
LWCTKWYCWWNCVQILINAELQIGKRGEKTVLTGKSPLKRRRSAAVEEEGEKGEDEGEEGGGGEEEGGGGRGGG